jgi:uncharacterized phiE125 gp8 family phage protein
MLATVDQLKAELGISGSSQDDRLSLLLAAASSAIEGHCGRTFARASITEQISPRGRQTINLARYPIASIASVTMGTATITDYQRDDEAGQLWREGGWTWAALSLPDITQDPDPNMAARNVTVTYAGGYILPGSPGADLPAALQFAAIRVAAQMYSRPAGYQSERTPGGYSYTVADQSEGGYLYDVLSLIEPYRAQAV